MRCRKLLGLAYGLVLIVAASAASVAWAGSATAQVADFYKGKTVRILVGGAAGAAYDFVGRVLQAHMGRHIPGQPSVVVENMPGAASLVMVNHLYNRAERDGTVMGMPLNGIVLEPRLKVLSGDGASARFDLTKVSWIGTPARQPQVLWVWHELAARSVEDLRKTKFMMGATAPGGDNYILPTLMNRIAGTQMSVVTGYKGVNDIFVAAERGEVHGNTANFSSLLGKPDWMQANKARILVQFGTERLAELKDVPTAAELAPDEAARKMWQVYATKYKVTYPVMLPPEVPAERVKALQAAFDATMKDAAFIADAKKIGIDVSPLGGEAIRKIIRDIDAVPQDVIDRLRELIK